MRLRVVAQLQCITNTIRTEREQTEPGLGPTTGDLAPWGQQHE